ncbi:MAG: hypothetical protein KME31_16635 [Tolypothrix carrinoi HA7290-LM1]|jgi:DNA-binding beta-propeller fold protein YncE|nr:hypothetical protein [Tolypothrix carrinoi HA7290-LM1]
MSQEVLLYTQELQAAKQEIESLGGRVTQQFTDVVIVVNLPNSINPQTLKKSSLTAPPNLDEVSQIAANAWMSIGSKRELAATDPKRGLPWDTPGFQAPRKIPTEVQSLSGGIARSTGTPTSLYMAGSIAVGVVIVSGPSAIISFDPKTPVTALSRKSDHIDVFAVGTDGLVYTNWWDGSWHDWGTVGNGVFPQNTPIAAIARRADHIDVFAVGTDGLVYTNWWDGSWHDWGTVGNGAFPQNTPIAAIARRADHIDVFAVGTDGLVYTNWWDGSWHDWGTVGNGAFPQNTPIAAIARRADHIDVFAVGTDGLVYTNRWDGSWHDWGTVGNGVFPQNTPIAAIARRADHIDVFAVGTDGLVYTNWWDDSWHDWGTVGNGVFPQNTPIAAIARRAEHIDVFAVGTDGLVYTNWWDGSWHDWGTVGNTNGDFPLLTPVAAIARHQEQIDLFGVRSNGAVYTTWWNDSWHDWASIGGDLSISHAERLNVVSEIQQGLSFLANEEPRANISFVYDIHFIEVTAVPGDISDYESAEAPWRDAALQKIGFAASRQGSVDYVQQLRQNKGTDWAYVGYFTKYQLHHFAYAGGERICMEYANDGWGSGFIDGVFAHETCHIFGAEDEYDVCTCGGASGYLGVPNNNCVNCTGIHEKCLMDRNDLILCRWTRGQIGWGDPLLGFMLNTPITSLARMPEHIDVFAVGQDGAVYTTWWDGSWHNWGQVSNSNGLFPTLNPIAAIARKSDHIDVFAVGTDGLVYTNWWDGSWHDWGTVGNGAFPQNTPIAAIARRADHIDVFAVGTDGLVYTNWWDGSWHDWGTVGNGVFPQNTPIAAIARRADHIDVFAVGTDGLVYTNWWDGSWHDWGTVGNGVFPQNTPIAAIARKSDHIDVFAVGTDGLVYTNWWDGSWHDWGTVGNGVFPQNTPIAAIARKSDHIDVFAVGTDGLVYTNWWDGSWHDWGTVGNGVFPQNTPIAAIARKSDHIDVFAVGTDGAVYTNWWNSSWHDWTPISNGVRLVPKVIVKHFAGAIQPGTTAYATITLPDKAPATGTIVRLTSSNSTLVKVSGAAIVPAGETTTTFPIQIADNAANATVTLTAISDFTKQTSLTIPAKTTQTFLLGTKSGFNASVLGIATNGRYVYAAHYYSKVENSHASFAPGELVVIDGTTFKEVPSARVSVGYQPRSVAVNPLTKRIYVVNYGQESYSLSILDCTDPAKPKEITQLKLNQAPIDVAVNSKTNRIYVTNPFQRKIHVIDGNTNTELTSIKVGDGLQGLTIDEAANRIYVARSYRSSEPHVNALTVIQVKNNDTYEVLPPIPIGSDLTQSLDVAVNPTTNRIYVANLGVVGVSPSVTVLDRTTYEVITTVKTIAGARAIAVNPGLNQIYIGTDSGVQIMDGVTNSIMSTIPQKAPWGIAVDLTTGKVYASSATEGTVTQFAAPDLSTLTQWS